MTVINLRQKAIQKKANQHENAILCDDRPLFRRRSIASNSQDLTSLIDNHISCLSSADYLPVVVILNPALDRAAAAPTAAETGVEERVGAVLGAALRLCAMCAWTRCPAARAAHKLSSPAKTPAATMRAN